MNTVFPQPKEKKITTQVQNQIPLDLKENKKIFEVDINTNIGGVVSDRELITMSHPIHAKQINKASQITMNYFKQLPVKGMVADPIENKYFIGKNVYASKVTNVGLSEEARFRHLYVIGQTGTGKSSFLEGRIRDDILAGRGVTVIDPHGDLVENTLKIIPENRVDDVILYDPTDSFMFAHPPGLNLCEVDYSTVIGVEQMESMVIDIFMSIEGKNLGSRFINIMKNAFKLLEVDKEQFTLGDILYILLLAYNGALNSDQKWLDKINRIEDPIKRDYFLRTLPKEVEGQDTGELVAIIISKFTQFLENEYIKASIVNPKVSFDFSEILSKKKIFLANLSKGKLGLVTAKFIGHILVSRIKNAAFLKPQKERVPHYLYIDEFQNFVSKEIESILSEARKFKLGMIIAHQYMEQLQTDDPMIEGKVDDLSKAVLGNVGNMIILKIGPEDAEKLLPFFPELSKEQFSEIPNLVAYSRILDANAGEPINTSLELIPTFVPFEEKKLDKMSPEQSKIILDRIERIKQNTAKKYGYNRDEVIKTYFDRLNSAIVSASGKDGMTFANANYNDNFNFDSETFSSNFEDIMKTIDKVNEDEEIDDEDDLIKKRLEKRRKEREERKREINKGLFNINIEDKKDFQKDEKEDTKTKGKDNLIIFGD